MFILFHCFEIGCIHISPIKKENEKLIEVVAFFRVDKGSVSGQIEMRTYVV